MIYIGGKLINARHVNAVVPTAGGTADILMIDGTWIAVNAPIADVCLEILQAVGPHG